MEITTFKIASSLMVNPSNTTGAMIATTLFIAILLVGYTLAFVSSFTRKYSSIVKLTFVVGALLTGVSVMYIIREVSMEMYPEAYESHVTCKYVLKNESEEFEHITLIPRQDNNPCASIGTQVTRVKTPNFTKFFLQFEEPR